MSGRALRKLRQEREAALAAEQEEDDDDESEEEEEIAPTRSKPAFALMHDDSDSISSSSSNESEDEQEDEAPRSEPLATEKPKQEEKLPETDQEENLDDILEEFQEQDLQKQSAVPSSGDAQADAEEAEARSYFSILAQGLDIRDLDVDHVMRTSLLSAEPPGQTPTLEALRKSKRKRQIFLFGTPANLDLNVKPPHYVGGGIGMNSYDGDAQSHRSIPWPYSSDDTEETTEDLNFNLPSFVKDPKRWYTFLHSDSYERDYQDFKRIQEMGDLNALVLFVAHHPFVTEALMYLGLMMYQVNQGQEGLAFLRRCIWVYESATLVSFIARSLGGQVFLDYDISENKTYFNALFRLARVNDMAGLQRASLAISRFILSIDPLRDPVGILLAMDHYALATNLDANDQWLVDLVEGQKVRRVCTLQLSLRRWFTSLTG